jgi:hypothetical protein
VWLMFCVLPDTAIDTALLAVLCGQMSDGKASAAVVSCGSRPARNAVIAESLRDCLLPDLTRIIAAYETRPGTLPDGGVRCTWCSV